MLYFFVILMSCESLCSVFVPRGIVVSSATGSMILACPVPEVIKKFMLNSAEDEIYPVINVKMPTIVGILTFISMINTTFERLAARSFFICQYFSFYEQLKFRAQLC